MKNLKLFLILGVLAVFQGPGAYADSIGGSVYALPITVNLNNSKAFAYYGVNGISDYQTIAGTATTDSTNSGQFSSLSLVGGSGPFNSSGGPGGHTSVTYTGAISVQNTAQQNAATGTTGYAFVQNCNNGIGLSLSTKLIATTETISFYLQNYNTTSNLTATLNGTPLFVAANQVLPTVEATNTDGTGTGNTGGMLAITVTGTVGETLTFSDIANYAGVGNTIYGNVGINAVTVNAVAAPASVDIAPMTWTATSTGPTNGRSDWINVKSCSAITGGPNAVGNGTTDDTTAIQGVLTYIQNNASVGATIYFPSGTYLISSTLTLEYGSPAGGVQVIGNGRNSTIKWTSASSGIGKAMFRVSNAGDMLYSGLVWDGGGNTAGTTGASCAYQHNPWNSYETQIRHENESFKNFTAPSTYSYYNTPGTNTMVATPAAPAAGIMSGYPGDLTGEVRIYNCHFTNCANGAYCGWEDFNYYVWHIDSCEFDNCGIGFNGGDGGCLAVSDTHFQGSATADIMGGFYMHVRHCTSVGSNAFISQGGGNMIIQDCWVDGWKNIEGAINFVTSGSDTVFDSTFTNPPLGAKGPVATGLGSGYNQQLILSGNYAPDFPVGTGIINDDQGITDIFQLVPPGLRFNTLTSPAQTFLKTTWPADSATIINIKDPTYAGGADPAFVNDSTAAIQAALTHAATLNNGSIVYIPAGMYKVTSTLNAPTGKYSIEGATGRSLLTWWGASNNTVLKIATPQSMTVRSLRFYILDNPTGGDSQAPTCDADTITCIQETSTGSSSITYSLLSDWGFIPEGPNPGPSSVWSNNPGLVLSSLPAGSTVYGDDAYMPLTVQNSSAAQIFSRISDGAISVSGTSAKTGFLGSLVAEGGQQTPSLYNIIVNDNQDLVVGDYYTEQRGSDLELLRGSGTGTGRVTIEGFSDGSNPGATMSINVNNYSGRLFYCTQNMGDNSGASPVQIAQTGTNPIDMILMQNAYTDGLTLATTLGAANLIQTEDSAPSVQPALTAANLISVGLGFDHLRQLEAVDLSMGHGLTTDNPPIAAYPMENNVLDTTTSYNGTNHGATFVPGLVGSYAAQFNGTSSYIAIPRSVTGNLSIAMWIQTTDTGGAGQWHAGKGLLDGYVSGTSADLGTALNAGQFSLGIGNPDTTLTSTVAVNDGLWHHVVATRNSTTGLMQVYVDGVLNNSGTGPTGTRSAASSFRIGSIQTGIAGGFFNGTIDQVQIYNYVVSAKDVVSLYQSARPALPQSTHRVAAHWALDEASGPTSIDISGHGLNGTWENGPTFSSSVPPAITFADPGCLSFNGSSQFVNIPNMAGLPTGTSPRTICGWAKSGGISGYGMFASYGTASNGEGFWIGANGTSLSAGSWGDDIPDVPNFWDGNWHFIALTYDGTTASLYADGILKESAAKTWNLVPSVCYIGCYLNNGCFWNGSIDDVRIYNYALSASQVANLAAGNP